MSPSSSGHNSEYNWWFRKRPDLIEKYCIDGTGWNPGAYGYILKEYQHTEATWKEGIRVKLDKALTRDDLQARRRVCLVHHQCSHGW